MKLHKTELSEKAQAQIEALKSFESRLEIIHSPERLQKFLIHDHSQVKKVLPLCAEASSYVLTQMPLLTEYFIEMWYVNQLVVTADDFDKVTFLLSSRTDMRHFENVALNVLERAAKISPEVALKHLGFYERAFNQIEDLLIFLDKFVIPKDFPPLERIYKNLDTRIAHGDWINRALYKDLTPEVEDVLPENRDLLLKLRHKLLESVL